MCNCFSKNLGLGGGLSGVVGATRNAAMNIPTASASATFTADEIIVETSAGTQYRLNAFNKTINLATVGAGGMDVGTMTNGYLAIYAIYNPTTGVAALLGYNPGTGNIAPNIYPGSNMPAGFTASALVSVWLVSGSLFVIGYQTDRNMFPANNAALANSISSTTPTVYTFATGAFPANAKTISGYATVTAAANQTAEFWILTMAALNQGIRFAVNASAISAGGIGLTFPFNRLPISVKQTIIFEAFASTTTAFPYGVNITGYSI